MWKQWVNAIAGAVVIVAPFLGLTGTTLAGTLVAMGAVVIALSLWHASEMPREESGRLHKQYAREAHHGKSHA